MLGERRKTIIPRGQGGFLRLSLWDQRRKRRNKGRGGNLFSTPGVPRPSRTAPSSHLPAGLVNLLPHASVTLARYGRRGNSCFSEEALEIPTSQCYLTCSMERTGFDCPVFAMHFVVGAVIGFVLSGAVVLCFLSLPWWVVGTSSLVFALLGGCLKHRLWEALGESPILRLWSRIFP